MSNNIGDYDLLEQIGYGATGRVWRARHRGNDQTFALKELRSELADDPEVRERFLREGSILMSRELPGVVKVHATVIDGDRVGLVMDLVEGPDLRHLLSERGPLPPAEACALARQLAATLAVAHDNKLVHRDVKPENVMVLSPGSLEPRALLTDFGLARVLEDTPSTRSRSQAFGTHHYVAPEVLRGVQAQAPADVYALGVVLFEMLMGWRPFRARHPAALMEQHLHQTPDRPAEMSDEAWAVVVSCLTKDPERRPTARALSANLALLATRFVGVPAQPRTDPPEEHELTQEKRPAMAPVSEVPRVDGPGERSHGWVAAAIAGVVAIGLLTVGAFGATNRTATSASPDASPSSRETSLLATAIPSPGATAAQSDSPQTPTAQPATTGLLHE